MKISQCYHVANLSHIIQEIILEYSTIKHLSSYRLLLMIWINLMLFILILKIRNHGRISAQKGLKYGIKSNQGTALKNCGELSIICHLEIIK